MSVEDQYIQNKCNNENSKKEKRKYYMISDIRLSEHGHME